MMNVSNTPVVCYACLKDNMEEMINLDETDFDRHTFFFKLKSCVSEDLEELPSMYICNFCLRQLRQLFEFREMVLTNQQSLRSRDVSIDEQKPQLEYVDIDLKETSFESEFNEAESKADIVINQEQIVETHDPIGTTSNNTENVECEHCDLVFSKKWKLRRHEIRVHNLVRNFSCPYCNKSFKQSTEVRQHIATHTGEYSFNCTYCEKRFQNLSSLKRHLRTHEAPPGNKSKRTPFLCNVCGKSFPYSNGLQRHMRTHFGIRNHECQVCKRKFRQSTHLSVHMRTHTGERPYVCEVCGDAFALRATLRKHLAVHGSQRMKTEFY